MANFSLRVETNLIYLQEIVWVNRPDSPAFIPLLVMLGFSSFVRQGTSGKSSPTPLCQWGDLERFLSLTGLQSG